jgi:hypothetical protein
MILSDLQTSFTMPSCYVILQKYAQLQKENFQGHVHRNEHFQNSIGCGLMVHNNNQIGNVAFML